MLNNDLSSLYKFLSEVILCSLHLISDRRFHLDGRGHAIVVIVEENILFRAFILPGVTYRCCYVSCLTSDCLIQLKH